MMNALWQDLRYGARMLMKKPGFTLIAVLTLSLGIGANTAIFSLVNVVLLRPLPFAEPERLVWTWGVFSQGNQAATSPPDFLDYRAQNRTFEEFAAMMFNSFNLTGGGEPERIIGASVTANFFPALGLRPIRGRAFLPEEEKSGRDRVVIVGQGLWQRRFGGDPDLVGKTITLDGRDHTVVGIAPAETRLLQEAEMWTPINFDQPDMKVRRFHFLRAVGRLKPASRSSRLRPTLTPLPPGWKNSTRSRTPTGGCASCRCANIWWATCGSRSTFCSARWPLCF